VIGVALDSKKQPDYQRIKEKGTDEYYQIVLLIFKKIHHCFMTKNFKILVLSGFGLGAFSSLAKDFKIKPLEVFKTCFENVFQNIPKDKKIILNYVDFETTIPVRKIKEPIQNLVFKINKKYIDETLLINAWDPFSIIGNGNNNDPTLDGYFGRMTAMSVLGWSITNTEIEYETVL
jgi:hypothetical protein